MIASGLRTAIPLLLSTHATLSMQTKSAKKVTGKKELRLLAASNEKQKCSTTKDLAARLQIVRIYVQISHLTCLFPLATTAAGDKADGSLPSKQLLLLFKSLLESGHEH